MREFGITVDDSTGQRVTVYFISMGYADWVVYSGEPATMYDPSAIRYILQKYVTRCSIRKEDGTESAADPLDLLTLPPKPVSVILDTIVDKSGFGDTKRVEDIIEKMEKLSRTLIGSYDLFILIHTNIDTYIRLLEADVFSRASVIMALEKSTGINVSDRFKDCIEEGIPLDIANTHDDYIIAKRRQKKGQPHAKHKPKDGTSILPPDVQAVIEQSKTALEQQMGTDADAKDKRKKVFDWHMDEAAYHKGERDQEKNIMDTPVHPTFKDRPT